MIILSVGMPRAGSGWHYNLIHDLMATTGCREAREIRRQYHLEKVLTEVNCNIGVLSPRRLTAVLLPSLLGNTFVIKAHAGPTPWAKAFIRLGLMRTTYIYRDPRDAMLSAYEYGQRAVKKGHPNAFSALTDFEATLNFMSEYVRGWQAWIMYRDVLHARYEDMLVDYDGEIYRLLIFLKLDGEQDAIHQVIEKYRPEHARQEHKGLHYSKGKIGRFREEYTPEQQEIMAQQFGPVLGKMGYKL